MASVTPTSTHLGNRGPNRNVSGEAAAGGGVLDRLQLHTEDPGGLRLTWVT